MASKTPAATVGRRDSDNVGLVNGTSAEPSSNSAVVPMTTPFAMPPDCLGYNGGTLSIQSGQFYQSGNNSWGPGTVLLQDDDVRDRGSCLPSGVLSATYLPAVCPSGWTYYSMVPADTFTFVTTNNTANFARVMTTALCCPSGYSMFVPNVTIDGPVLNCTRQIMAGEVSVTMTVLNQSSATTTFQGAGTLVYPPMVISWTAEAASTMTPMPPDVDQYYFVPTWVPGTPAQQFLQKQPEPLSSRSTGLATTVFVAVIVVPILMFLIILGCCICCFRSRRRKEKREIEKERVESEAAAAAAATATATATATTTINTTTTQQGGHTTADGGAAADSPRDSGRDTEAAASAQGHSPSTTNPFDDSMAIQRPSAEQHTAVPGPAVHSLSDFAKPPYPGLPSHSFDGIDEPPPYMESARYDAARGGPQGAPAQAGQQTQQQQTTDQTEREAGR